MAHFQPYLVMAYCCQKNFIPEKSVDVQSLLRYVLELMAGFQNFFKSRCYFAMIFTPL